MSHYPVGSDAAASAAAAAARQAQVIKASGAIVQVEPEMFLDMANRHEASLIITAEAGFFRTHHRYLMSHRGYVFFTRSPEPLSLPPHCELIAAKSIWVPE